MVSPKGALFSHVTTNPDGLFPEILEAQTPSECCSSAFPRGCLFSSWLQNGCSPSRHCICVQNSKAKAGGRSVLFCSTPIPITCAGSPPLRPATNVSLNSSRSQAGPHSEEPGKDGFGRTQGCQEPKQGCVGKKRRPEMGGTGRTNRVWQNRATGVACRVSADVSPLEKLHFAPCSFL